LSRQTFRLRLTTAVTDPDRTDWDTKGFQNYLADSDVPAIIEAAGHKTKPQPAEVLGTYDA
jgi:hypothetical protein